MHCTAVLPMRLLVRMTAVVGLSLISLHLVPDAACAQLLPGPGPMSDLNPGPGFTTVVPVIGEPWGAGVVFQLLGPTHGEVVGSVTYGTGTGLVGGDYTQIYMGAWIGDPVVSVEGPITIYTFDPDLANPPASYDPVNGDVFHVIVTGGMAAWPSVPGDDQWFPGYRKAELTFPDLDSLFNFNNAALTPGLSWRPVITPSGDLDLLVVPEPGTLVLLAMGGLGLLLLACCRKAAAMCDMLKHNLRG